MFYYVLYDRMICLSEYDTFVLFLYVVFPPVFSRSFSFFCILIDCICSSLPSPFPFCSSLCARVYIYNVCLSFPLFLPFKKHVVKHIYQSVSYEKVSVNIKKSPSYILRMSLKGLLLHPLSGTEAAML